jgi:hypothetical protein
MSFYLQPDAWAADANVHSQMHLAVMLLRADLMDRFRVAAEPLAKATDRAQMTLLHHIARVYDAVPPSSADSAVSMLLGLGLDPAACDGCGRTAAALGMIRGNRFADTLQRYTDPSISPAVFSRDWLSRPETDDERFQAPRPAGGSADAGHGDAEDAVAAAMESPRPAEADDAGGGDGSDAGIDRLAGGKQETGPAAQEDPHRGVGLSAVVCREGLLASRLLRERVKSAGVEASDVFQALVGDAAPSDAGGAGRVISGESLASGLATLGASLSSGAACAVALRIISTGGSAPDAARAMSQEAETAEQAGTGQEWLDHVEQSAGTTTVDEASFTAFCEAAWTDGGEEA